MAISAFGLDEVGSKSPSSTNLKRNPSNLNQLVKIIAENQDITSAARQKRLNRIKELRSPYVFAERGVQFLSGITERKIIHKRPQNFKSSFPLASRIYRANSDEFKVPKRTSKKVKKSVLTLPNDPTPTPCTVSDLNENEYNRKHEEHKVETKRMVNQRRHRRERKKNFMLYDDRDARHADLGCSSDETIKHGGDFKNSRKGRANHSADGKFKAHDVWAVLRNINQFQFQPLPPESGESSLASSGRSKKRNIIRHYKHPERRLIETRRTEQISYIASFEIDDRKTVRATSPSQSTSLDRVTVINNGDARRMINKPTIKLQSIKAIKPNQTNNRVNGRNKKKSTPRGNAKVKENKIVPVNERNKIIKGRQANARHSVDSVSKVSNLSGGRDTDDSSNHDRSKYNDDDDSLFPAYDNHIVRSSNQVSTTGCRSPNSSAAKSSNQFSSSRCQSPNSNTEKIPMRSFEKLDNTRGTRKLVLNNGRNESQCESIMGRPHLVTTMPSAAAMPKLSPADVKRRLSLIRYPLVILGKDQLSSTIEVPDYEAPQFDGLDKQVWPFMVEWSKKPCANTKTKFNKHHSIIATNSRKATNDTTLNKAKEKKPLIGTSNNPKKAECNKRGTQNVIVTPPAQLLKKPKPISQIRDKMFKLLYKKSSQQISTKKIESDAGTVCSNENLVELVIRADVFTETERMRAIVPKAPEQLTISLGGNEKMVSTPVKYTKRPWARGKWASDFIENVISKIRNGSYYSHDVNKICSRGNICKDKKGISMQTITDVTQTTSGVTEQTISDSCYDASELSLITDLTVVDPLAAIPGFDEAFTGLQIDSLSMNQISVKHCITNVVLQFDVKVQDESAAVTFELHKSLLDSSIVPLPDLNNHVQVFKCPTTFLNAVLPAELCTVLPRIKREFIDSKAYEIYSPRTLKSKEIDLYARFSQQNISSLPISLPIRTIIPDGEFSRVKLFTNPICNKTVIEKAMNGLRSKLKNIRKLLSNVSVKALVFCKVNPKSLGFKEMKPIEPEFKRAVEPVLPKIPCTALELYKANDIPIKHLDTSCFRHILEILNKCQSLTLHINCTSFTQTLTVANGLNNLTVGVVDPVGQKTMTVTISKLKVDSLFNGFAKDKVKTLPVAKIAEIESSNAVEQESTQNEVVTKKPSLRNVSCSKTKRRGYIKLYKKCKSSSNISGEKYSTALSKVTNLDEFFQALGTAKTLSSIFDGSSGQNIISAVSQMKNWITDLSPRQMMLVLLLANKKDTPNLVRYRPVLLQGIAVNRITRASELDMEIEVIERENVNQLSQCDGNSLLRCMENNDSLLEELCWIAKTTSSDYQKPFDESSEKLLKSLLEKRKKLNPSYLRVMARYVGLGLLKAQNNKN